MLWGQLAIKAAVSGVLIAAASELARRSPGWGGLVVSLPLSTMLAFAWLWRDGAAPDKASAFLMSANFYVLASLPAITIMALLLRKGIGYPATLAAGLTIGAISYFALMWLSRKFNLPV